ncbi:MAG TPA: STAS domain-containing protein [Vicinamibacterales bacterium]|nr:STAS domain-containing protein [Vicinamibacterales bacterium]
MSPVPAPPHAWSVETSFDATHADTVVVHGRLGTTGAARLEAALTAALTPGRRLRLDLAQVDYISSAGLAVLTETDRRLRAGGGHLELVRVSETVRLALRLAGELPPCDL